ncbi:hypothetical protein Mam01_21520 [Microbispora amethystogenes]|uniref:Uncharacterized protein n=1 Tax=Microbispora amethystogenes TaxID=1427754 RepID=A0ABQ4FB27_9ACTN|nr:hypothetical protein Mam01_21520 [Microbispora amethystogenes]
MASAVRCFLISGPGSNEEGSEPEGSKAERDDMGGLQGVRGAEDPLREPPRSGRRGLMISSTVSLVSGKAQAA